jgi:hypothetical protein
MEEKPLRIMRAGDFFMHKLKWIFALILGVAPSAAVAQEQLPRNWEGKTQVWLNAGFLSYHFDRNKDYREDNWGLGAEAVFRPDHVAVIGTYLNSDYHRSRYIGYQWRPLHWQPWGLDVHGGITVSVVDGYPSMVDKGWFIAPTPVLAVEGKRFGANFVLIPNKHGGAIAMQLKMKVW